MLVETKFLGEVTINEEEIITFEEGLPGFQESKKFVLLPIEKELPFLLLQSIEDIDICFVVAYPFTFKPDYSFDLEMEDRKSLQIEAEEEVITYTIVTLKNSLPESTLNLLAPVIININKKLGKQIVLQDSKKFPLRLPLGELEGSAK